MTEFAHFFVTPFFFLFPQLPNYPPGPDHLMIKNPSAKHKSQTIPLTSCLFFALSI